VVVAGDPGKKRIGKGVSFPESPFDLSQIAAVSGVASLEYQAEVGSTNDWALALAADAERDWPLLVLTDRQTGGRGRGANLWWSARGSLTFSLVVDAAALPPQRWPQLALVSGIAVCESLHALFPAGSFGLKWPNDVYLHGRKLCGILVEAPSQTGRRIVIGVGINVNNSFAEAPPEVRARGTSLCDVAGGTFDMSETLAAVVQRILQRIDHFTVAPRGLAGDYRHYCLLAGQTVHVQHAQEQLAGRCEGIDEEGALLVTTASGIRRLHSGTVLHWEAA
jgi:BirA family biotin operon repressor/biotin-[acetyl-CoA-carboxylase] ligase